VGKKRMLMRVLFAVASLLGCFWFRAVSDCQQAKENWT